MGRIELVLGPSASWPVVSERLRARVRHRQLLAGRAGRGPTSTSSARPSWATSPARMRAPSASRRGGPTSAFRFPRPTSSGCSARACRRRCGWKVQLDGPDLDRPRRGAARRGVLLLRQASRSGRPADRRERAGALPGVGRDRFAGRRLARDAARVPRAPRPLPRPAVPAGERRCRRSARLPRCCARYQLRVRLYARGRSASSSARS